MFPLPHSPLLTGLPPDFPALEGAEQRHELATAVTQRGLALLSSGPPEALPEALCCFETAIVLRRDLPLEQSPWFRWGLSAGWMNRGDALARMGSAEALAESVRSYDEALAHLQQMVPVEGMNVQGRHVLAWMNRAVPLRAQGSAESRAQALHSLEQAQSLLDAAASAVDPLTRATVAVNRAALLLELTPPRREEAMQVAEAALQDCADHEQKDALAAETGLKARHAWCYAVALLLEEPPLELDTRVADEWIHRATDRVEEALTLSSHWLAQAAQAGPAAASFAAALEALRLELFRYGCRIYLAYQPHFMAEFLLDVLDPERGSSLAGQTAALHHAGVEALALAAEVLKRRGPLDFGLKKMDRLLEVLQGLSVAAERIKKLPK